MLWRRKDCKRIEGIEIKVYGYVCFWTPIGVELAAYSKILCGARTKLRERKVVINEQDSIEFIP